MAQLHALLFLPVLIVAFRACDAGQAIPREVREIPVASVTMPDDPRAGEPLHIRLICNTPTPCWEFLRSDITHKDSTVTIRVYARYDGRPCVQIPGTLSTTATVSLAAPGRYRLILTSPDRSKLERVMTIH
jgi:hypothetical protein